MPDSTDSTEPRSPRSIDDALDVVYQRAAGLRRQRLAAAATGVTLVLATLVAAASLTSSTRDPATLVSAADDEASTTTTASPATTVVSSAPPSTGVATSSTSVHSRPPTSSPPTTMPDSRDPSRAYPLCGDGYDPDCGHFYWKPDPGPNAPLELEVTFSPAEPKAGEEVTVTVVARDPDHQIGRSNCDPATTFGDESPDGATRCIAYSCVAVYGPWAPPERQPDEQREQIGHTYDRAGTYRVEVLRGGDSCGPDPYVSAARTEVTITVT